MELQQMSIARLRDVQQVMCRDVRIDQFVDQPGQLALWYQLWSPSGELIYVSEKVTGSTNPEWATLDKECLGKFHSLRSVWFVVKGEILSKNTPYTQNFPLYCDQIEEQLQKQYQQQRHINIAPFKQSMDEDVRIQLILHSSGSQSRPLRVQFSYEFTNNLIEQSKREDCEVLCEYVCLQQVYELHRNLHKFEGTLPPNSLLFSLKDKWYSHIAVNNNQAHSEMEDVDDGVFIEGNGEYGGQDHWMGRLMGWRGQRVGSSVLQSQSVKKHKRSASLRTSPGDLERSQRSSVGRRAYSQVARPAGHTAYLASASSFPMDLQNTIQIQSGLLAAEEQGVSGDRSDTTTIEFDSGEVKAYDEDDFIMELKKIEDCQRHLRNRQHKRDCFREELRLKLEQQQKLKQQTQQLQHRKQYLAKLQAEVLAKTSLVQEKKLQLEQSKGYISQRCIALGNAVDVLYSTMLWVKDQQRELEEHTKPACNQLLIKIISRRCHLVAELGHIFQVGASTLSVWSRKVLEEQIDQWWMMPMNQRLQTHTNHSPENGRSNQVVRIPRPPKKQIAKLTILGLEVNTQLVQLARDKVALRDVQKIEINAAALGYVAHMVYLMAAYLNVPLRYPVYFFGSRSFLIDPYPPQQEARIWTLAYPYDARKLTHNMRYQQFHYKNYKLNQDQKQQVVQQSDVVQPVTFPLFYSARKGIRYDYAVFKLNADIKQLLNIHGLTSDSPINVLQNLQKLVEQARAGIPKKKNYDFAYLIDDKV